MKQNKYVLIGRRWFDKINGNTYHSVTIIDVKTNKEIVNIPLTYGYDDAWKHTAYDYLIKMGLVKQEDRNNHELNHKRFIYTCCDVTRKKDL